MDKEAGIKQIEEAQWVRDDAHCLNLHVTTEDGRDVWCWLSMRPAYCDRGHIQLNIDMVDRFGEPELDRADSFPRYFFSFEEADEHTRAFLKWRLWQHRSEPDHAIRTVFYGAEGIATGQ